MPPDLYVADQQTMNGVRVVTRLVGERYVSEAWCGSVLLNRAENTDRFFAGLAHGAFLFSWASATESNVANAAQDARAEGYAGDPPPEKH